MKIGFYCESPTDQAAVAVFVEGILGEAPEPINMDLEGHGVPAFFNALDGVFRGVHYNSDAEGLVVVVDCDDAPLHDPSHETIQSDVKGCRYCQARGIIDRARNQLKPVPGKAGLRVAIGVAVPTIEAWYLTGKNPQIGEAQWKVGLAAGSKLFARPQLKKFVYGTDRPSLELETNCAVEEARRIIGHLQAIETAFPVGFGLMAAEIRSWTPPKKLGGA